MSFLHSPLTGKNNIKLIKEIKTSAIISAYRKSAKIDVSSYFHKLNTIKLYECQDTRFCFYYPLTTAGNDSFYKQLQKFPWYYMRWKWEHETAKNIIKPGEKILEIGCATGTFIKQMSNKHKCACTGLELNKTAVNMGKQKGLKILSQTIQEHSKMAKNIYDSVCAFQVIEHIPEVKEFLISSIESLKVGGRLVLSVPNNDSFIKYDPSFLNVPPHHMGLWNHKSLESLEKIFPLRLKTILLEPLQQYHYRSYLNIRFRKIFFGSDLLMKIFNRIVGPFSSLILNPFHNKITGHTILAVYEKK